MRDPTPVTTSIMVAVKGSIIKRKSTVKRAVSIQRKRAGGEITMPSGELRKMEKQMSERIKAKIGNKHPTNLTKASLPGFWFLAHKRATRVLITNPSKGKPATQ